MLDLTHLPFLHSTAFNTPELSTTLPRMEVEGIKVRVVLDTEMKSSAGLATKQTENRRVRTISRLCFESPAVHLATTETQALDAPAEERRIYENGFVHAFTPIDQVSTRYFWCVSRDEDLKSPEAADRIRRENGITIHQLVVYATSDGCGESVGASTAGFGPGKLSFELGLPR